MTSKLDESGDWDDLPQGTYATILTGRDVVSRANLAYPVVWTDRPYGTCPRCKEPVDRTPPCPVALDDGAMGGGRIEENSQQHGCGYWLAVDWDEAPDIEAVPAVAQRLAGHLAGRIYAERARVCIRLIDALREALARRDEPLVDETIEDRADEIATGTEVDPGVYINNRWADPSAWVWCAWDYDPAGLDEEGISVYIEDLEEG